MDGTKTSRSVKTDTPIGEGFDAVKRAEHYNKYGIECKEFSRHFHGPKAQAFQYIWRSPDKGEFKRDLEKAIFWLEDWLSAGIYCHTQYESGPIPEPVYGFAPRDNAGGPVSAQLPNINQLRGVAGNFSYNLGRALESIFFDNPTTALELIRAELQRHESEQQSAVAVPTTARGKR